MKKNAFPNKCQPYHSEQQQEEFAGAPVPPLILYEEGVNQFGSTHVQMEARISLAAVVVLLSRIISCGDPR